MRKIYSLLPFFCFALLVNAQTLIKPLPQVLGRKSIENEQWAKGGIFYGYKPSQEVLERRTANAKHFRNPNGTFTVQTGGVYHYKDEQGAWQDIDLSIRSSSSIRNNNSISNESNALKSYFPNNAGNGGLNMVLKKGIDFNWWQKPKLSCVVNGNVVRHIAASQSASGVISGNKITYHNAYNAISEQFVMLQNGIENNTILHSLNNEISALPNDAMLEFSQFVPLKAGWGVDVASVAKTSNFTANDFHISIPGTDQGIFFSPIVVFDNSLTQNEALLILSMPANKATAEQIEKKKNNIYQASYQVRFVDGGIEVVSVMPVSWLKKTGRSFPVTIDPTITITPSGLVSGGTYYGPTSNWFGFQRHADLYLASELGVSNIMISAIEYNRVTTAGTSASKPYKVYMRTTPAAVLAGTDAWNSTTYTGGLTALYDGSLDFHGTTTGYKMITLSNPYLYSADNLLIMVYDAYGGSGSTKYMNISSTVTGRQASKRQDTNDPGDGTATAVENYLADIRLTYTFAAACTNPPTAGTASSNVANVCSGNQFTLSVTGISTGSDLTYQWQSSPNNSTWTDIPSATSLSYVGTQVASTYYRFRIVCSGGTPAYSNAVQVVSPALFPAGTYTINQSSPTGGTNFNNFTDAFNAINCGIAGAVTFNVSTNQVFNEILPALVVRGSSTNTVTFKKSGAGSNPVISRNDAGTLTTSSIGGQGDAIVVIQGGDYITFDGIDVSATDQGIEYGYLLRKASGTDGCKNVTIKNASITMNRGTNTYVTGIYSSNLDASSPVSSAAGVTVSSIDGRHESVTITGNTINNVFHGIQLRGFAASAPYSLYDSAFVIGATGSGNGNTINNFGGTSTTAAYGIFVLQQKDVKMQYNNIANMDNGGVTSTSTIYGIYLSTNNTSAIVASNNTITLNSAYTSGSIYGVYNSAATGALSVDNNTISLNNSASTSGTVAYIYNAVVTLNTSFSGNTFAASTFTTTGTGYFIYNSNANISTVTIQNNTTGTIQKLGSAAFYGYYNLASPGSGTEIFSGNTFSDITLGGTSSFYGFYSSTAAGHRRNIYGNNINSINAGGTLYGIYVGAGFGNVYKNKIYNLTTSSTASSSVVGIYITSGVKDSIYNNIIGGLTAPTLSAANGITGIYLGSTSATSTIGVYYNTVFLEASSSGTNFGSSAIYAATSTTATSAALEMKNNIFVNNSTPNGTGITAAYRRSSTALNNFAATSNNNLYYVVAPSPTTVFFTDGTNLDQTLADYKTRVGTRETSSITEYPNFVSINGTDATYLHLSTTGATQLESGGSPVGGITDDYDGNTRNTGTPDIGADEFNGIGADFTPPSISFTPALAACSTGDRTLTGVSIVDAVSGVPTTGALVPRIYYRKGSGTWYSKPGTLASGSATNGSWNFTIVASDMGGLSAGNVVSYYIIAQDAATTPNIATLPSGAVATNVNTVSAAPSTPYTYLIGTSLNGTYTVGTGGAFETLTNAVAVYNGCAITGPVTFSLISTNYPNETYPITIGENTGASVTNYLTIKPAAATAVTILGGTPGAGNSPSALIQLNGADYVTIDGVQSGGASLTLEDTSSVAGTAVVWLSSIAAGQGATNNTIKRLNIKGGVEQLLAVTTSTYGVVIAGNALNSAIGSIVAGDDNDNNIIDSNTITKVRYGIFTRGGSATNLNQNNIIKNNTIGSTAFDGDRIGKGGIVVREEDGIQISRNEIRYIGGNYTDVTTGADKGGITIGTDAGWVPTSVVVKNAVITRNSIHDVVEERTFSASGIAVTAADATNATNNVISNNIIYNLLANGTSGDQTVGIGIAAGKGDKIVFNSIYLTGDTDPTTGSTTPSVSNYGINISSSVSATAVSDISILNNNVVMDLTSSSATTLKNACITIPASYAWGTGSMNYNNWYILSSNTQSNVGCTGGSGGTFYPTLSGWQTASTKDANSKNVDPLFVSPTDLHLQSTSTLDNQGTPVTGVTVDFDGDTRNIATPDIGADEFNNNNCTGAVGGTATATKLAVCAGDSSSLSVTGFSLGIGSSYIWQVSTNNSTWNDITGATNPSAYNTSVLMDTRYYRFKVTCTSGTAIAYSNVLTVTVTALPTVTVSPATPAPLCTPATQVLSVTATSATSPTYQWMNNGADISSATASSYTATGTGVYSVKVTGGTPVCTGTSAAVTVTINQSPSAMTITPSAASLCHTTNPAQQLAVTGGTISGVVILSDNFNSTNNWAKTNTSTGTTPAAADWTLRPDNYVYGTTPVTFHSNDNSQFYMTNSDAIGTGAATSTTLTTPAFSTMGFSSCNLQFYHFFKARLSSSGKVDVSTNGTTWTTLNTYTSTDAGTAIAFAEANINLDAYIGNATVYVRFTFTAGWDWYWAIDNVTISGSQTATTTWSPTTGLFTDAAATTAYTGGAATTVYAKPTATTTYTATATSAANCTTTKTVTITSNCSVPVTLLNFRGEKQGSINNLSWTTTSEINNAGFELERSADGANFSSLGFIASKAINGNSIGSINYSFADIKPLIGNGYYRLKQVDKDGKATYSQVVLLKGQRIAMVDIVAVYPNPTSHKLNLVVTAPATDRVTVLVTDVAGKVILQQVKAFVAGDNTMQLDVSNLASGTYLIKATCQNGCESSAKKFVKQ